MKSAEDTQVAAKFTGHISLKKNPPEIKEGETGVVPGPAPRAGWTLGLSLPDSPCIPDKDKSESSCDKNQGQREKTRGQSGSAILLSSCLILSSSTSWGKSRGCAQPCVSRESWRGHPLRESLKETSLGHLP